MLTTLEVKNYAVVAATTLELEGGMTVLSGETGAGKSIIVGALGLALGDRADAGVVRDGTRQTEISASFNADAGVDEWLQQHGLDADGECLVRRVISREGRSRAWINGHAVTLQTLRELGGMLVDIHGQHAHQSLTQRSTQRSIVDSFAGNADVLTNLAQAYKDWRSATDGLDALELAESERDSRRDLLRFQLQELEALAPQAGEHEELIAQQKRLAHAGGLAEGVAAALGLLSDDDNPSVQPALAQATQRIAALVDIDQRLGNAAGLLDGALIQVGEAISELGDYADGLELDPQRRDQVEERLATMQALGRKHRVSADELADKLDALRRELQQLEHADEHRDQLLQRQAQARQRYDELAKSVSGRRRRAGKKLDRAISTLLQDLGMTGGQFVTRLETDPAQLQPYGTDTIDFLVSANTGQEPRSLARVASGGELSRISLAIEVLAARHRSVPTLVFDEVDTGVGGSIAEIIGQKLRLLGETAQVICVTHLPQVASQAHHHVRVTKHSDDEQTETRLALLGDKARAEEIARMLGGVEITSATRKHAREMLARGGARLRRRSG